MMATHRGGTDYYYTSNEDVNRNYQRWQNYAHVTLSNTGYVTGRSRNGQYNIIEKGVDDHKVLYYVPTTYRNDYDMSQLDEPPIYEEQQHYPSTVIRRRYYEEYDDDDDYFEELPIISPRRHIDLSPRRTQIIRRIYHEPPPKTVEYIYKEPHEEIIEYIVQDDVSRQRYIEQAQPIRRSVHVENLPPVSRSPHRTFIPNQSHHLNELSSPRRSKINQLTPRTKPFRPSPNRTTIQHNNDQKPLSLKDVLAQNRARRGPRIPKPRREVDEEHFHDLPTYNRNFIKNDFIVHK